MTTIDTIHDLHRILLEHPEWQSELRNILLTQESLALPGNVDQLTQNVDKLTKAVGTLRDNTEARQDRMSNEIREFRGNTNARLDRMSNEIREFRGDTEARQDRMSNEIREFQGDTNARLDRMGYDVRNFRGNYVSDVVRRHPADIALALSDSQSLGLDETTIKVLTHQEIVALARAYGSERLAAIPLSERRSFYRTDLIMSVHTADGEICYIVLQGSYTCDERDTNRAITGARLLRQFTGDEAWPAVAGVRIDNRIRPLIESGEMFWYRTEEEDIEPPQAE